MRCGSFSPRTKKSLAPAATARAPPSSALAFDRQPPLLAEVRSAAASPRSASSQFARGVSVATGRITTCCSESSSDQSGQFADFRDWSHPPIRRTLFGEGRRQFAKVTIGGFEDSGSKRARAGRSVLADVRNFTTCENLR